MSGDTDLDRLIAGMNPEVRDGLWVFATLPSRTVPEGLAPLMVFQEAEGTTLILAKEDAEAQGIAAEFPCRMITLNVHSALEAVGFIARITTALTAAGIGVNPVAGFHHDHLFVPDGREDEAMAILKAMAG